MTAMHASPAAYALIREFEGLRLEQYCCSAGKLTIGYGSTSGVTPGMKITLAEAETRLKTDIEACEKSLNAAVRVVLSQNQFDALVSIVFNIGPGTSRRDGIIILSNGQPSTLLRLLNAGRYADAAAQFGRWNKAVVDGKMVELDGLSRRRASERALFSSQVGVS